MIILNEVSQKEKQVPYDITYMQNIKYNTNEHMFLPGESQERGSLVGCRLWGRTESDTTEVT